MDPRPFTLLRRVENQPIQERIELTDEQQERLIIVNRLFEAYDAFEDEESALSFSTKWMVQNGYDDIIEYAKENGGIDSLMVTMPVEIREDFFSGAVASKHSEPRTPQQLQTTVETAVLIWSEGDTRAHPLTTDWLRQNGYTAVVNHFRQNGHSEKQPTLREFMAASVPFAAQYFQETALERYSEEQAYADLTTAFQAWRASDQSMPFNVAYLQQNSVLVEWVQQHVGLEAFIAKANVYIRNEWERQRALEVDKAELFKNLQLAFETWQNLHSPKAPFDLRFVQTNYKHASLATLGDLEFAELVRQMPAEMQMEIQYGASHRALATAMVQRSLLSKAQQGDSLFAWLRQAKPDLVQKADGIYLDGTERMVRMAEVANKNQFATELQQQEIVMNAAIAYMARAYNEFLSTNDGYSGRKFNREWITMNAPYVVEIADQCGGIDELLQYGRKTMIKRNLKKGGERDVLAMQRAHWEWSQKDKMKNIPFNSDWLADSSERWLAEKMRRIGAKTVKEAMPEYIQKDLFVRHEAQRTSEEAVSLAKVVYDKWVLEQVNTRGTFQSFLRKKNYPLFQKLSRIYKEQGGIKQLEQALGIEKPQ